MGFDPIFPTTKGILRKLGGDDNTRTIKWAYTENTEGLVVVGGALIKVSSLTPSIEELEGGTLSISGAVNEKVTLTAYGETTTLADIGGAIMATDLSLIVYSDNFVLEGVAFPEKGIYMPNMEGQTLELSYGTIHPIDPKYLPKGGVGYEESTVLTHDGNNEGKEVLAGDFPFARIADVIDPTAIVKITMLFNGTTLNITADELTITGNDYYKAVSYAGNAGIMIWYEGNTAGASAGTYVVSSLEAQTYVSRIVCKTTHKIEPKFLPGVCLPVVELSTVATSDGAALTNAENALMSEVYAMGVPFVLKVTGNDGNAAIPSSVVCSWMSLMDEMKYAIGYAGDATYSVIESEGTWIVMLGSA